MTKTILELLQSNPQGLTDKQIGEQINRPNSQLKEVRVRSYTRTLFYFDATPYINRQNLRE